MNIKHAREYFEMGIIRGFESVRDPLGSGWLLVIVGKEGRSWTLQTSLGKEKVFFSLDTLVSEVESISGRVSSFAIVV